MELTLMRFGQRFDQGRCLFMQRNQGITGSDSPNVSRIVNVGREGQQRRHRRPNMLRERRVPATRLEEVRAQGTKLRHNGIHILVRSPLQGSPLMFLLILLLVPPIRVRVCAIVDCSPLPIPPQKYDQLKEFAFEFNPKFISR